MRQVLTHLSTNRFVLKTDVHSYYDSIDHFLLLEQLAEHIEDRGILNLFWQYLTRSSEQGGLFWDYEHKHVGGVAKPFRSVPSSSRNWMIVVDGWGCFSTGSWTTSWPSALLVGVGGKEPGILSIFVQAVILSTIPEPAGACLESSK